MRWTKVPVAVMAEGLVGEGGEARESGVMVAAGGRDGREEEAGGKGTEGEEDEEGTKEEEREEEEGEGAEEERQLGRWSAADAWRAAVAWGAVVSTGVVCAQSEGSAADWAECPWPHWRWGTGVERSCW